MSFIKKQIFAIDVPKGFYFTEHILIKPGKCVCVCVCVCVRACACTCTFCCVNVHNFDFNFNSLLISECFQVFHTTNPIALFYNFRKHMAKQDNEQQPWFTTQNTGNGWETSPFSVTVPSMPS